jgi:ABC-type multidrug transport system fused ATPase/permease subunit
VNKQLNTLIKLITLDIVFIIILMSFLEVFLISIFLSIFSENNIDIFNIFDFLKKISTSMEGVYLLSILFIIFNISSMLYLQMILIKKSQTTASTITKLIFRQEINDSSIKNDFHSSEVNKILLESVIRFSDGIVLPLYSMLQKLTAAFFIVIIIFYYSLYSSLIFIIGFSIFLLIINKFINKIFSNNNPKISELSLIRSKIISDGVSGKEMIFSYGKQFFWEKLLSKSNTHLFKLRAQNAWLLTVPRALIEALIPILLAVYFILKNSFDVQIMTIYELVPSIVIFFRLAPLLQLANANYNNLKSNKYALDELKRYHYLFAELHKNFKDVDKLNFNRKITDCKSIELNDVSLDIEAGKIEYPNLKLEKGKIYVVSGPSGVGKSLLLTLLTGQIQPHSGEIKFSDGINENEFDLCKLDYRIMRQKDFLFSGTVAENIIFDDFLDLQREQLLAKLFAQLNLGPQITLQTSINENASNISGGQAQRLHFIRCMSKPSSIYLLDEPSSALNLELENKMIKILKEMSVKSIVVIVSHSSNPQLDKFEQIKLYESNAQNIKNKSIGEV